MTVQTEAERLLRAGDVVGAEKALQALWPDISQAPASALVLLAQIRVRQKRPAEADRLLQRAVELAPNDALIALAVAEFVAASGDAHGAVAAFDVVVRLDPTLAVARIGQGRAALASGRPALAEAAARALLAQDAANAEAWDMLCNALRAQDKLTEAIAAGDEAVRLAPNNVSARHGRAVALSRAGRNGEALAEFEALAAGGVAAPALTLNRGVTLLNMARDGEAETAFAEGVRRWPGDKHLQDALANVRWMRAAGGSFTSEYEAAIARAPDALALRLGCADLLRRADLRDRAEAILRDGLARTPDQPALLVSLGVLLDECDRTAEGLPLLQRASAQMSGAPTYRSNLACALLRLGRGDEALSEIAPLRQAEPLNQEWICYETMALRQLGDPRYGVLCNYERMVRAYDLPAPRGYRDTAEFNAAFSEVLSRLHVLETHPLDQSLRHGSQTTRSLLTLSDPVIEAYLAALDEPIRAYIDAMGPPDPSHPWSGRKRNGYAFSGCWSVKLKANGFHINHLHPAGWISSAYYVAVPAVVAEGQQGWIKFGEPRWPVPGCAIEKVVQPAPGRLVLFPSYMWHGTIPFAQGERLTAPFDLAPI